MRKKRRERSKRPSYPPSFTPLPSLTALHCVPPFSIPLSPHSNSHLPLYLRACERFEGRMNGGEKRWCRDIASSSFARSSSSNRQRFNQDRREIRIPNPSACPFRSSGAVGQWRTIIVVRVSRLLESVDWNRDTSDP